MKLRRIACVIGIHNWKYQFPYIPFQRPPEMAEKRRCGVCGQVELAYERWHETEFNAGYRFDRWVREEDWYKLSYIEDDTIYYD